MDKLSKIADIIESLKKLQPPAGEGEKRGYEYSAPYLDCVDAAPDAGRLKQLETEVDRCLSPLFHRELDLRPLTSYIAMQVAVEPLRREFLKFFENGRWMQKTCPFCGGAPGLSRITEQGARNLICAFCWTEWEFQRVSCAFCGKEAGGYALFDVDGGEARVDYCEECKGYMKTFSSKPCEHGPVYWDISSIFMDIWAVEQGYVRPAASLIGIDFSK